MKKIVFNFPFTYTWADGTTTDTAKRVLDLTDEATVKALREIELTFNPMVAKREQAIQNADRRVALLNEFLKLD